MLVFFLLCHFLVELFDFLFDFCCVFCVRIQIEVALVGLDGLLFQPLFLLCFAEVAERNRVARLGIDGVFEAVDGRIVVPGMHIVLSHFNVFFRAQGVPLRLIRRVFRGIGIGFGRFVGFLGRSRGVWRLRRGLLLPILGDQYGRVLERGELKVCFDAGAFYLTYYDHQFPIAPGTYRYVLDLALEKQIIEKRGSWLNYRGTQLAQGRDAAKDALKTDRKLYEEIETAVKAKLDEEKAD